MTNFWSFLANFHLIIWKKARYCSSLVFDYVLVCPPIRQCFNFRLCLLFLCLKSFKRKISFGVIWRFCRFESNPLHLCHHHHYWSSCSYDNFCVQLLHNWKLGRLNYNPERCDWLLYQFLLSQLIPHFISLTAFAFSVVMKCNHNVYDLKDSLSGRKVSKSSFGTPMSRKSSNVRKPRPVSMSARWIDNMLGSSVRTMAIIYMHIFL